jgi:N-acetylglutamate synthase-like GNAT family acetyltransferase
MPQDCPITIRQAFQSDVPSIVSVIDPAFADTAFEKYLKPYSEQYPEDRRRELIVRTKQQIRTPGYHAFVAVKGEGSPTAEVVGFALWLRVGNSERAREWQRDTLENKVERALLSAEDKYNSITFGYRHMSPSARDYLQKCISGHEVWAMYPEMWRLRSLAVAPGQQGKGVGAILMRWGLEKANEENVPVALVAVPEARGFYTRSGLEYFGGVEGLSKVMEGSSTLHAMVYKPPVMTA